MDALQQIAFAVRQRRQALGLTLADLASAAGCAKSYLSAIENRKLDNPPSHRVLQHIEAALDITPQQLTRLAEYHRTPPAIRDQLQRATAQSNQLHALLQQATPQDKPGKDLDALYHAGSLHQLLDQHQPNIDTLPPIAYQVPLINNVAAGYPSDFTDLDYPARVADQYLPVHDLPDPAAFAARVVGNSMLPEYREGEVIVFSPTLTPTDASDCFVRLLPDHHTTFKRIFFEPDNTVRLQPLNPAFKPQHVPQEQISGLYPALYKLQHLTRAPFPISPDRQPPAHNPDAPTPNHA